MTHIRRYILCYCTARTARWLLMYKNKHYPDRYWAYTRYVGLPGPLICIAICSRLSDQWIGSYIACGKPKTKATSPPPELFCIYSWKLLLRHYSSWRKYSWLQIYWRRGIKVAIRGTLSDVVVEPQAQHEKRDVYRNAPDAPRLVDVPLWTFHEVRGCGQVCERICSVRVFFFSQRIPGIIHWMHFFKYVCWRETAKNLASICNVCILTGVVSLCPSRFSITLSIRSFV